MAALHDLGVGAAAKAIRAGEISAEQFADALLARAAAFAGLNAFIALDPERVREAARKADKQRAANTSLGPLHGVPLALKDNLNTAEMPTTGGTPGLANNRPKRNAVIVDKLFAAGAINFGKTNLHELAYGISNNNAAHGPARNPYAPDRIPGASSGGTGVAVSARVVPGGIGSDTGGSVRIPAALCGIVGFRPTTGRWSQAGIVPISHTRDTAGPMTRSVADCALLDGVVTGGPTDVAAAQLKGLRLGVPKQHFW
jgi:mandelamide amidase